MHTHDDLLEDLSRQAHRQPRRTRSSGYLRRLDEIKRDGLTAVERLEHRMLAAQPPRRACSSSRRCARGSSNPQFYADILASSLAGQALFTHAPAAERARRVLSKLRQTPRLIQAARDNIKDPPGIFVKVGIETMRGALKFIDDDLPRAFATSTICTCSAISPTRRPKRRRRSASYVAVPRNGRRAAARGVVPARAARSSSRS